MAKKMEQKNLSSHDAKIDVATLSNVHEQIIEIKTNREIIQDFHCKLEALAKDNYSERIKVLKEILSIAQQDTVEFKKDIAKALLALSSHYGSAKDYEQSLLYANDLIASFREDQDQYIRTLVAKGLVHIGISLKSANDIVASIQAYDEAISYLGERSDAEAQEISARATFNKASALQEIGSTDVALLLYDGLISYLSHDDLTFKTYAAESLMNKCNLLFDNKKYDLVVNAAEIGMQALIGIDDPNIVAQCIGILVFKSLAYMKMKNQNAAIAALEAIEKFKVDKSNTILLDRYGVALFNKALLYRDTGNSELLIATVNKIENFFIDIEKSKFLAKLFSDIYKLKLTQGISTGGTDEESTKLAVEATKNDLSANLSVYLTNVFKYIDKKKQAEYFERINNSKRLTDKFIKENSYFYDDASIFLVLRQWNSYTPIVPAEEESDRGGGYFLRHAGEGVVVDPGYDFIDNFFRAGGRYCDIDHIVITHAHDDHTAEFESLLMLLHQYNQTSSTKKRISLYLSQGAHKKFSGLLDLRDKKLNRVVTLCAGKKGFDQKIQINDYLHMTVLPAYHDDVISGNTAVGIGFEVYTNNKKVRKIVITGDSGLFPRLYDSTGSPKYYDLDKKEPELDATSENALYNQYPDKFIKPDLLIAHIGSIKQSEFGIPELNPDKKVGQWFYANHLGLLGTLTMLHQLCPEVAVISEFGSELRGFHIELVAKLGMALNDRQVHDNPIQKKSFVLPGDLTIIYDINEKKFLCHDTCKFGNVSDLICRAARNYTLHWDSGAKEFDALPNETDERVYLFKKSRVVDVAVDNKLSKEFFRLFFNHKLPFHKR